MRERLPVRSRSKASELAIEALNLGHQRRTDFLDAPVALGPNLALPASVLLTELPDELTVSRSVLGRRRSRRSGRSNRRLWCRDRL